MLSPVSPAINRTDRCAKTAATLSQASGERGERRGREGQIHWHCDAAAEGRSVHGAPAGPSWAAFQRKILVADRGDASRSRSCSARWHLPRPGTVETSSASQPPHRFHVQPRTDMRSAESEHAAWLGPIGQQESASAVDRHVRGKDGGHIQVIKTRDYAIDLREHHCAGPQKHGRNSYTYEDAGREEDLTCSDEERAGMRMWCVLPALTAWQRQATHTETRWGPLVGRPLPWPWPRVEARAPVGRPSR